VEFHYGFFFLGLTRPVRFSRSATMVDKTMAIKTTVPMVISETFVGIST
jgi:hypothetical protein